MDLVTARVVEPVAGQRRARPAPWEIVSALLALAAAGVAGYLTYVHYQPRALVCSLEGGCHTVQESEYATLAGVPIALLGMGLYVALLGIGVSRWLRPALAPPLTIASFGMVLCGVIYYGYLTYVELAVLDAICQWCVACALLTVGLLGSEGVGVWKQLEDDS